MQAPLSLMPADAKKCRSGAIAFSAQRGTLWAAGTITQAGGGAVLP